MAKYNYSEVDPTRKCLDCHQPLKKNLLARVPGALRCDTCYKLRSNSQNFNRERYKAKQRQRILTNN